MTEVNASVFPMGRIPSHIARRMSYGMEPVVPLTSLDRAHNIRSGTMAVELVNWSTVNRRRVTDPASSMMTPKTMNTRPSTVPDPFAGAVTSVGGGVTVPGPGVEGGVAASSKSHVSVTAVHGQGHGVDVRGRDRDAGPDRDLETQDRGIRVLGLEGGERARRRDQAETAVGVGLIDARLVVRVVVCQTPAVTVALYTRSTDIVVYSVAHPAGTSRTSGTRAPQRGGRSHL